MKKPCLYYKPEHLFLLFALPLGVVFAILLPPLAGSDEYFHFQRIATIAYGHMLNEEAKMPLGISQFLAKTLGFFNQDGLLPYSAQHFFNVAAIPLGADMAGIVYPNHLTVHNPVNYIPQALAFRIGAFFGASPLMLLYIVRLTGLLASVTLTFHAIRIIPSWKYALCALALLPPLALYRVSLSADTMTDAVGMLFLACIMREITRTDLIKRPILIRFTLLGLFLALCKFPYACATLLVLAIPARRFHNRTSRTIWCALTIMPGTLAGIAWMEMMRRGLFAGLHYETWGGSVYPDGQVAFIIHNPLAFAHVLANTLMSWSFHLDVIKEMAGHFGTMWHVSPLYYISMLGLLTITIWMDGTAIRTTYPLRAKLLVIPVFAGFILLTLTALYIHWTGLQAPAVKGFQGRYYYPLMPLLLMLIPLRGRPHPPLYSALATSAFAVMGLSSAIPVLLAHWR